MCIKLKITHYWFRLLVICGILHLFVSVYSSNDGTCSKTTTGSNISISEKTSNNLQSLLDVYHDNSEFSDRINAGLSENGLSSADDLSLKKNHVNIYATDGSDVIAGHVVPTIHSESSSSSSQLDPKGYDVRKKSYDGLRSDLKEDLNGTRTETFRMNGDTSPITKGILENIVIHSPDFLADRNGSDVAENFISIESTSEDIPSFREWTEKHLAEKEKERGDDNITNVLSNGKSSKMRNKNYASLDCGAKLLAANPEAKSAGSLLSTSRDEYLLSACNCKIWFIVELCEAVQLKRIELANFELFSSSPKEFSVLISDRFPSRDWTVVGQFTANDDKSIQSFDLQPHHFTKYLKVEFHSHYGKEHFCPVSLFRVYGTSEIEVLETVDGNGELDVDNADSDFDANEPIISDSDSPGKKLPTSNNLFGSAKEAVMNMVKKAAEVLVINTSGTRSNKSEENLSSDQHLRSVGDSCVSLRYLILCRDCKEEFFHKLHLLLSCHLINLKQILSQDLVWKPLIKYNICMAYGFTSFYLHGQVSAIASSKQLRIGELYAVSLMSDQMVAALCNLIAISENRVKQNTTVGEILPLNVTLNGNPSANHVFNTLYSGNESVTDPKPVTTVQTTENTSSAGATSSQNGDSVSSQIKPSKTLSPNSEFSDSNLETPSVIPAPSQVPIFLDVNDEQNKSAVDEHNIIKEPDQVDVVEDSSLDSLISELERTEESQQAHAPVATPKPAVQKESVFIRLANRIKALERNMSLSGQYLEELSKRYKKQVEDMQRVLSEVTAKEAKRSQEVVHLTGVVTELTLVLESLLAERQSWSYKALLVGEHSMIVFLEIAVFIGILCLCRGIPKFEISKRKFSLEWHKAYIVDNNTKITQSTGKLPKPIQSQDDLNFKKPHQQHKRRPSEEAMKFEGNTHQHLLIHDSNRSSKAESRRRKRKRRELLLKSNANAINLETGERNFPPRKALPKCNAPLSRSASVSEIDEHSWGRTIDHGHRPFIQKENKSQNTDDMTSVFKTATSVRMKRLSCQFNGNVLSPVYDASSDPDSSLPSTPVKEKKVHGLKKIVKKFF